MKPQKLGRPCWDKSNIPRAISSVAQVDVTQIDYFLASHSPIEGIINDNTGEVYSEESFFEQLLNPTHGEVLALIHGDPGTGKSHLIHWLKLRCDDALTQGELKSIVPVLVQRRSGSLKDALQQIVQQLPRGFDQYLTRISEAIGRISEATARLKLAQMLFLELSLAQRSTRNRIPLTRDLKDLPDICASAGFREWLCRDGGIIDRNIKRLDQGSEIEERENEAYPYFTETEFVLPTQFRGKDTPQIRDLADELEEDQELRERAAVFLNEVLPDALREMTGLSDAGLRDIFDKIRSDLKTQDKELALFIEDISVMSALDEEVFVAVEPQSRGDLCRMIAVLGLTNQGWMRLPDNQRQRVTHPVAVGGQSNELWRQDRSRIAKFSARYLNTVRLDPEIIGDVAKQLRRGNGLTISACTACPVETECHATFGSVSIDSLSIGTFPFTLTAPQRLLSHLEQHATTRQNPRGLLSNILRPILAEGHDQLETNSFPSARLAVSLPEPNFWTAFEQSYCGNWSREDKNRLKFFIQGWTASRSLEEAATIAKPFLEPLGLPIFGKAVAEKPNLQPTPPPKPGPSSVADTGKLDQILTNLRRWLDGDDLIGDADIRNMLLKFFRDSLPWDDEHEPPLEVWKKRISDAGNKPYRIEGMRTNPGGVNLHFEFARSAENHSLFEALAQFEFAGRGSWDFSHAELYKRNTYQWLRRHKVPIVELLAPTPPFDSGTPVRCAIQILSLAATLRRRNRLPIEAQDSNHLVGEVLMDFPSNEIPAALSSDLNALISDLVRRQKELKRLLISEISSPQGRTGRPVFINPEPIISAARTFAKSLTIEELEDAYFEGSLSTRYHALSGTATYASLFKVLEAERAALQAKVDEVTFELKALGISTADPTAAIMEFCNAVPELVTLAKQADIVVILNDFDDLRRQNVFSQRRDVWATAFRQAVENCTTDNLEKVIVFDPKRLIEFHAALKTVSQYLEKVGKEVDSILSTFDTEGDPDALMKELMQSLDSIKNGTSDSDIIEEGTA